MGERLLFHNSSCLFCEPEETGYQYKPETEQISGGHGINIAYKWNINQIACQISLNNIAGNGK